MFETITAAQWLNAGTSIAGAALGSKGAAGPSRADSGAMGYNTADFSGWSVSTGGGLRLGGASSTPAAGSFIPLALVALAGLWLLKRK